jgi:hypothetical protein
MKPVTQSERAAEAGKSATRKDLLPAATAAKSLLISALTLAKTDSYSGDTTIASSLAMGPSGG